MTKTIGRNPSSMPDDVRESLAAGKGDASDGSATKASTMETALRDVFSGIMAQVDAQDRAAFSPFEGSPVATEALAALARHDLDAFDRLVGDPMDKVRDGLLLKAFPHSHEARFLAGHARFVEAQFDFLITRFEGSSCSVDKRRHVLRKLLAFLATGKEIAFDRTAEYTYMIPSKVLADHERVVCFFKAVYGLHYGRVEAYMLALADIQKSTEPGPSQA